MLHDPHVTRYDPQRGVFSINLHPHLAVRLRYSSWDDGVRVQRFQAGTWREEVEDPQLSLIQMEWPARRTAPPPPGPFQPPAPPSGGLAADGGPARLPLQMYLQTFPLAVCHAAAPFQYLQTSLLQLAARYPAAREMLASTPLLLWLLAHCWQEHIHDAALMRVVLSRRRTALLSDIYEGGTAADVRFLSRVTPMGGDWGAFRIIGDALPDDRLKHSLRGWPRIPLFVLAIVKRYPELLGSRLLRWLGEFHYEYTADGVGHASKVMTVWEDVMRMGQMLGFSRNQQLNALRRCRSREMLNRLHNQWVRQLNRRGMNTEDIQRAFPPPPLPGNDVIQALTSDADLMAEGRDMHHCVASYRNAVRSGYSYIYRVLEPQRATLEISCPQLSIVQFKLAHNEAPSEACWRAVQAWLKAAKAVRQDGSEDP